MNPSSSPTPPNIWTRETVTSKAINPGIGTTETTNYAYTGGPQYTNPGWNEQFRGFGQVQVTDAALNYVVHYFYTNQSVNGKLGWEANRLTGREYKTIWYNNGSQTPVREVDNTWNWNATISQQEGNYEGTFGSSYRTKQQESLSIATA